jgi:hypothetical protein
MALLADGAPAPTPTVTRESLAGLKESFAMTVLARRLAHIEHTAARVARLAARPLGNHEDDDAP